MSLGNIVRRYREKRRMSISAAAFACDLAPEYLGQIEDGIAVDGVTLGTVRKLIIGLDIPADTIAAAAFPHGHDCPRCSGDCSAANPPVLDCPRHA